MLYIEKNGIKVPKLGFGTWKLEGDKCIDGVKMALDIGYRHIDTAQAYGNEAQVGSALKESGIKREDIFLTTKIWRNNLNPELISNSFEESLEKLKTDYVDLLLIHWPTEDLAPFAEQIVALEELLKVSKTKNIGISNFTTEQIKYVKDELDSAVITNQVEYHPYLSQAKIIDCLKERDMFLTAYSPLARGKATTDSHIIEIAEKYGKTASQVTLRWLIQQGDVVAIPKASSERNIRANFDIFDFEISPEDMQRIFDMSEPDGRIINPDFAPKWDN